jgi:hypothetical protein
MDYCGFIWVIPAGGSTVCSRPDSVRHCDGRSVCAATRFPSAIPAATRLRRVLEQVIADLRSSTFGQRRGSDAFRVIPAWELTWAGDGRATIEYGEGSARNRTSCGGESGRPTSSVMPLFTGDTSLRRLAASPSFAFSCTPFATARVRRSPRRIGRCPDLFIHERSPCQSTYSGLMTARTGVARSGVPHRKAALGSRVLAASC